MPPAWSPNPSPPAPRVISTPRWSTRGCTAAATGGSFDYLFIENVGNLVCPAVYDLGQDVNVVALSVTEGEDKPLKYPTMFQKADLVLITKIDLLPALPHVRIETIRENLSIVMPAPRVMPISAVTGEGLDAWVDWLRQLRAPRASAAVIVGAL